MESSRNIGLSFTSESDATLIVWAPLAKTVKVKVKNALTGLQPDQMGLWTVRNLNIKPGDDYQIGIDGKLFPDPASLWQPAGVHEASRAFDLNSYRWSENSWPGKALDDLIIYELHTGTFTAEGTFDGIVEKLDYLKELGITAIELMPVAQFPGSRNWGYDGVYPFAVQDSYGGPEGLQNLVDVCHQKGLAVILDVVYNHLGPEGNYLPAFGPIFTDKYKTPWGQAINFDDAWCDGVRMFFIENALMWLRDFRIDGLRLDAVHAIKDFGSLHILRDLKEHVKALNSQLTQKHFLIAESDLNDTKFISPFEQGGYDLDATWCDEFHHSLHSLVTGETNGYYADFGSIKRVVKSLNDAFVFDGIWSEHRKRVFGNKTQGIPGHKFVVFTQNHDQIGNRMLGDRLSTLVNFEVLKVLAGIMLVSPFTPLLFMGEEYAETRPFLYFTSHSDKELIRLVREGRKNEFKDFMNTGEIPDPDAMETFTSSKLNWNIRNTNQEHMFSFYKELIRLKKNIGALKNTNRHQVSAQQIENKKALYLIRKYKTEIVLAFINFEATEVKITSDEFMNPNWNLLLNSSDARWGGPHGNALNNTLDTIPSLSISIWTNI